jgi:AraC-like DNA-binding protein
MPGSVTSVFSEPTDFEAALRQEGVLGLLVTGHGEFRARLTQVALHRLRLSAAEEQLARIAFVAVPADMILVSLPIGDRPVPIWGGIGMRAGEITTVGPSQRTHARTDGPSRSGSIWLPAEELARYGSVLIGALFAVPSATRRWRPPAAAGRDLRQLHGAAIRVAETRPEALLGGEAVHGLEQQLIDALVECLSKGSAIEVAPDTREHQDVALRFEALLQTQPSQALRMAEICAALGVPARSLRLSCEEQLGMGPGEYVRRRRMQLVHRALRNGDPDAAGVSAVARRYGFRDLSRFASNYRALYGELPSVTLRRGSGAQTARLTLHRRHSRMRNFYERRSRSGTGRGDVP